MQTTRSDWFKYVRRLQAAGDKLVGSISIPNTTGLRDPKVVAVLLLFRTQANFRATLKLIRLGMVVETRTVARCCYENQFFIAALAAEGMKFVEEMEADERNSRKMRGQFLLQHARGIDEAITERLRGYLRALAKEETKKLKWLNPRDVASRGPLLQAYIFYSQLSADAGHPSLEALDRHLDKTEGEDGVTEVHGFLPEPRIEKGEEAETLRYVCQAVLGTYVGVNQLLDGATAVNRELRGLWDEFNALTAAGPNLLSPYTRGKG
jgi:hypothetical protein